MLPWSLLAVGPGGEGGGFALLWIAPDVGPAAEGYFVPSEGASACAQCVRVRGRRAAVEAAPVVVSGAEGGIAPLGSSPGV